MASLGTSSLSGRGARVGAAPRHEALVRGDRVARPQGIADCRESVAELAEANEQIEDSNVPGQAEHRMQRVERPVAGCRNDHLRTHRKERREGALLLGTGIEAAFEKARIPAEDPLGTAAPPKCAPLLEPERNQDRDEIHVLTIISEILC
jgi:hypothetical protein